MTIKHISIWLRDVGAHNSAGFAQRIQCYSHSNQKIVLCPLGHMYPTLAPPGDQMALVNLEALAVVMRESLTIESTPSVSTNYLDPSSEHSIRLNIALKFTLEVISSSV
jgi:hypothetical protein